MNFSPVRLFQWGAIAFVLVLGAGLYWKHQGKNEGKAAQTLNASKETVMTNTLVGYWTLDGNDIVWGDANEIKDVNPGTKHDGNVAGSLAAGSAVPGQTGQGLLFNGTTDSISLGSVYNGVKTIAFWVKPNTTTQSLIDLNATATVDINAGTVRGNNFATPTIYVDGAATSTFPDTGWHHVAVTTDTGINANAAYIGQIAPSYFGGVIDDIRFYSDALTATQVADLYRASGAKEISNANHREALTDDGLVGYWTFDGRDIDWGDTGTEVKDISGNNNHGAVSGLSTTSVTPGKLGQGLSFNGTSDMIYLSTYIALGNNFTFSFWLKPITPGVIFSQGYHYSFHYVADSSCSWRRDISYYYSGAEHCAGFNLSVGKWNYVTITNNNGSLISYLNGAEYNTVSGAPGINFTYIGNSNGFEYFRGSLDDIRIYNRALSETEITYLYNLGR